MKKIIMAGVFYFSLFTASQLFADSVQCPEADKLRAEWSLSTLRGIEKLDNDEVMIYQKGHTYGTEKKWWVNFSVHAKDVDEALKKAPEIVKQAQFFGGGTSPVGLITCAYKSLDNVIIYAVRWGEESKSN